MTIHLPNDLASRLEAAVGRGQFASVDDAMAEAARILLRDLERAPLGKPPSANQNQGAGSIGAMRESADELDEIVSEAYERREVTHLC